ncbi:MAG: class I SAM-dependent methyltransferase [Intestinibacter sp.]
MTLSEEQFKEFNTRIKEENLQDYLEVRLMDYRELKKSDLMFDRVVSVGMLEHVGRENYELFIKNVNAVLKDGGLFLLHYISGLQESYGDPWIKKYIFPGGVIPSLREMIHICSDYKYHTIDVESLRLLCKNLYTGNFSENLPKIKEMLDDKFIRMWIYTFVLCCCFQHWYYRYTSNTFH